MIPKFGPLPPPTTVDPDKVLDVTVTVLHQTTRKYRIEQVRRKPGEPVELFSARVAAKLKEWEP